MITDDPQSRPIPPAASPAVVVADGYGISLTVSRGHLVIHDGIGSHRRTRRYPRIERDMHRILILGHTGSISLEAMRWCTERGIAVIQLDANNQIITLTAVAGLDDARLRRAQAHANTDDTGLLIARMLLAAKINRQAAVADTQLGSTVLGEAIRTQVAAIESADSLAECLDAESHAANAYFGGWANTVHIQFTDRDQAAVPKHWHAFASRRSPIMRGRTPRAATTPINALLNYLYALAEIECRIALITLGLDPGIGIVHVDAKARDSLALDLLEVARPEIDSYVLDLLRSRHFAAAEFCEARDGQCRLAPGLAHDLAVTSTLWAQAVAPYAERIAHLLAGQTSRGARPTPLTRGNAKAAQHPSDTLPMRRPRAEQRPVPPLPATCRVCGVELAEKRRQLCPACWPRTRAALATERARRGAHTIGDHRATGSDPTNTERARSRRAASLSARKREQLAWDHAGNPVDEIAVDQLPIALADVPLARIQQATGLSVSACSRIRSGDLKPHRRHWPALDALIEEPDQVPSVPSRPDLESAGE
jgi:CRISPR-associated endonuclease Cas1